MSVGGATSDGQAVRMVQHKQRVVTLLVWQHWFVELELSHQSNRRHFVPSRLIIFEIID